jgi:hypothetical protein
MKSIPMATPPKRAVATHRKRAQCATGHLVTYLAELNILNIIIGLIALVIIIGWFSEKASQYIIHYLAQE